MKKKIFVSLASVVVLVALAFAVIPQVTGDQDLAGKSSSCGDTAAVMSTAVESSCCDSSAEVSFTNLQSGDCGAVMQAAVDAGCPGVKAAAAQAGCPGVVQTAASSDCTGTVKTQLDAGCSGSGESREAATPAQLTVSLDNESCCEGSAVAALQKDACCGNCS